MSHVFIAPHPDDVALSCGGLVASLRELGQNVAIVTVFSGGGTDAGLTSYQREALGFGSKALWPNTESFNRAAIRADYPPDGDADATPPWAAEPDRLDATQEDADAAAKRFWQRASWYRRASIRNQPLAGQALIDDVPTQGATMTGELVDAAAAGDVMARRRVEDERYAYFAEASIVFLDLPDAVFRGYEGDDELLGSPRLDDEPPLARIRREIARLEPQTVYVPLGVGNHVDHQLCRDVGLALATEPRSWVMPGPDWAGNVVFYEDFPYAWWHGFDRLEQLPDGALNGLDRGLLLTPQYADISDQVERKIRGVALYESQLHRLFGGEAEMAAAVRAHGAKTAELGGHGGAAERYWHTIRA
ncbi:MAG: PIG-L family deacetylase [Chloroflexota bacterium]